MSKIYYDCDPKAGLGHPQVDDTYNCVVFFRWATSLVCTHHSGTPNTPPKHIDNNKHDHDDVIPVHHDQTTHATKVIDGEIKEMKTIQFT